MVDEKVELTEMITVSASDFARIVQERARLAQQVDELQTRGTKFMMERQEARRTLRIIANGTHTIPAKVLAYKHLSEYPT